MEEIKNKDNQDKDGKESGYKVGYKHPPLSSRFSSTNQPSPEKKSRKGTRDWTTDFDEAVELVAKLTKKTKSEIRTELLVKGILESRKGNFNFWKEIVERNYGKVKEEIDGNINLGEIIIKIINGDKQSGDKSN